MCQQLSKMHTGAPSHPFATTQRIVEKAFGRPLSSMFDEFEEEPVASGSIAQVRERGGRDREWRGGRENEREGGMDGRTEGEKEERQSHRCGFHCHQERTLKGEGVSTHKALLANCYPRNGHNHAHKHSIRADTSP